MVTAEYNYGYPAALKNAIDYLHHEWRYKPVGFVSYGGVAAGTRAVQQLKQVTGALQLFPTQTAVNIPFVLGYDRRRRAPRQRCDGAGRRGDARRAAESLNGGARPAARRELSDRAVSRGGARRARRRRERETPWVSRFEVDRDLRGRDRRGDDQLRRRLRDADHVPGAAGVRLRPSRGQRLQHRRVGAGLRRRGVRLPAGARRPAGAGAPVGLHVAESAAVIGAVLLLTLPASAFKEIVPVFIAVALVLIVVPATDLEVAGRRAAAASRSTPGRPRPRACSPAASTAATSARPRGSWCCRSCRCRSTITHAPERAEGGAGRDRQPRLGHRVHLLRPRRLGRRRPDRRRLGDRGPRRRARRTAAVADGAARRDRRRRDRRDRPPAGDTDLSA